MPVIAESPPLIFGSPAATPTPTTTPTPTSTPYPTQTPTPSTTTTPTTHPTTAISPFVIKHQQFVDSIEMAEPCFKRQDLQQFTDQEFLDYIEIEKKDKYIVQEKDLYCSMKGVHNLIQSLRRTLEEKEII
jgi:hypothetical protein